MAQLALANGAHLHYEWVRSGAPDAATRPVLVFLHEGLGCCAMWKRFPQRLCEATGCDGLMYDRQGYGQSSPLAAPRSIHYLHRYALEELPQVLAQLLPQRSYMLVGHSDGGSIALLHAAEAPPLLRGVVAMAAHVLVEAESLQGIAQAQQDYDADKLAGLHKYHGDKTDTIFHAWSHTWRQPAFAHWNITWALPAITCPVLVLQGVHDQYATPQHVQTIAVPIARARGQLLPDCAHSPHHENPQATVQAMATAIQEWIA